MNHIPESHLDLLADETKALLFLGTLMKDGFPQVTPVWFNLEDDLILINSAEGRVKDRNMKANPKVGMTIVALDNIYHYLSIQGEVVEITTENGREHINLLGQKYEGKDYNPAPGQTRTIYKIKPVKVFTG